MSLSLPQLLRKTKLALPVKQNAERLRSSPTMSLNCPNCGTNLVVRVADSTFKLVKKPAPRSNPHRRRPPGPQGIPVLPLQPVGTMEVNPADHAPGCVREGRRGRDP